MEGFDPCFGDVGHDESLASVFGGFEGVEVVDEDHMCRFHAVADHRRCIVRSYGPGLAGRSNGTPLAAV